MIEEKKETDKNDTVNSGKDDKLDIILDRLTENKDAIISLANLLDKMKQAGLVDVLDKINKDYTPTDMEFLVKFFSEKELIAALLKVGDGMMGLLYGLSDTRTSDVFKAISFNLQGITDGVVDGVKNPMQFSMLKLLSLLKDPDVSALITGLLNAVRVIVPSIRKVQ